VRRHDERALYGALPGAQHLPGGRRWCALAALPQLPRRRSLLYG
jgi:hypothetical protein